MNESIYKEKKKNPNAKNFSWSRSFSKEDHMFIWEQFILEDGVPIFAYQHRIPEDEIIDGYGRHQAAVYLWAYRRRLKQEKKRRFHSPQQKS